MLDVEIKIDFYCYESEYTHTIYLFYDNEKLANEYFWIPLENALDDLSFSGTNTSINAPKGLLQGTARYFKTDYNSNRNYKITVRRMIKDQRENIVIDNAQFIFKEDTSIKATYDNLIIKDVNIIFENSACQKLSPEKP